MRRAEISYRIYNNHEGTDKTLYVVTIQDHMKWPLQIFSSFESLEAALKEAEAFRKLHEEGQLDDEDYL